MKFQDTSIHRLKVKKKSGADTRTHGQAQSNMPYQLFQSWGHNQRTIGPENAHLKPDLGVLSHHDKTLTVNTHKPLLNS